MPAVPSIRVALVGYGVGGRYFHAPFIHAADGIELAAVVTRSAERRQQVAHDFPHLAVVDSLEAAAELGVDAAVITTPPETREDLVLRALALRLAVVADKPFAPDAETARRLRDAATASGLSLAVFHNRRWDADIRTLQAVLRTGELGAIDQFTSRMDQDSAGTLEATAGGGLLRDLGSHLVDQAWWLFGPVESVFCALDWRRLPAGSVDVGFTVHLRHRGGVRSLLTATKLNRSDQRELRLLGESGNYRSDGTDVQAQAVFRGDRPVDVREAWGFEAPDRWGMITTSTGRRPVPSERGAYQDYYSQFARALRGDGPLPVGADDAVNVLDILDAARRSDLERQVIDLV